MPDGAKKGITVKVDDVKDISVVVQIVIYLFTYIVGNSIHCSSPR